MIRKYNLFGHESALSGGVKYANISTDRKQGVGGNTGTDFDLTLTGEYGLSLLFRTVNYGAFLENLSGLLITFLSLQASGMTISIQRQTEQSHQVYNDNRPVSISTTRNILLGGVGAQYKIAENIEIYGNYSQAYRPILYSSLVIGSSTAVIDPNLKDATGYNV